MPEIDNDLEGKINPLNSNFDKKEFKELWNRINSKAVYKVHFDSDELIGKAIPYLNSELRITKQQYVVHSGVQKSEADFNELETGESFKLTESKLLNEEVSVHSQVPYDLLGKIAGDTQLTRKTVAAILSGIELSVFDQFKKNPEDFISKASLLINEQKATMVVEHLAYDPVNDNYSTDIFTQDKTKRDFSKFGDPLAKHVFDYIVTDSNIEKAFVRELDASDEVVVYSKLPKSFAIPTPVGNYNPDWAISFREGMVKHIYFVAETSLFRLYSLGTLSSQKLNARENFSAG